MWTRSCTRVYPGASKEGVWALWSDVNKLKRWNSAIEWSSLSGPFAVGEYYQLKAKGAPVMKIELVEIEPGKKWADCTSFFGARMYGIHELEETPQGLQLTTTIQFTGLLRHLWIYFLGNSIVASLGQHMDALVELASHE